MSRYNDYGHRYVSVPWAAVQKPQIIAEIGTLADPNADSYMMWDDSADTFVWTAASAIAPVGTLSADSGLLGGGAMSGNISLYLNEAYTPVWTGVHNFSAQPRLIGNDPGLWFDDDNSTADNQKWLFNPGSDEMRLYAVDDAEAVFTQFVRVTRTGTTVDTWQFENTTNIETRDGALFRVYDSGNTDYIELSDTGSAARLFTNTNRIDIRAAGVAGIQITSDPRFEVISGMTQRIYDSGNTDYLEMSHDGTDFFFIGTNTRFVRFSNLTSGVQVEGTSLWIADPTGADKLEMSHDGTGFTFAYTNTGNVTFSGITGDFLFDSSVRVGTATGGQVLTLRPGTTADHAYMAWFADSALPSTRSGYFGFAAAGTDIITLANELGSEFHILDNTYIRTGSALRVYDSGNTDYLAVSHDGSDLNLDFTNTGNINFNDGIVVNVFDSTNTDSFSITQSTGATTLTSTQHIVLTPAASHFVYVYDPGQRAEFQVYDSTGADRIAISHDGTNSLLQHLNTTDLIISGAKLVTPATTTTQASLNAPHGTAPTSPVDGDIWTTTAGIYVRINGSTIGPLS